MTKLMPAREKERLAVLQDLAIVDTEPEAQFDAICRHACNFFQVPIAYIAFIDEGRQWLKAACGIRPSGVPRAGTFCARTILLDRVLIVTDASAEPRFASNPYVLGPPHICFYAGAPITLNEDLHVGTLCLIDTIPRDFSREHVDALRLLADYVVERLQIRAKQRRQGDTSCALAVADGLSEGGQPTSRLESKLEDGSQDFVAIQTTIRAILRADHANRPASTWQTRRAVGAVPRKWRERNRSIVQQSKFLPTTS